MPRLNEIDKKFIALIEQGIKNPEELSSFVDTIRYLFPEQWQGILSHLSGYVIVPSDVKNEDYFRTLSKEEKIRFLNLELAKLRRKMTLENVLMSEENLETDAYLKNLFCVDKADLFKTMIYGADKQTVDSLIEEGFLNVVAEHTYRLKLSAKGKKELDRSKKESLTEQTNLDLSKT